MDSCGGNGDSFSTGKLDVEDTRRRTDVNSRADCGSELRSRQVLPSAGASSPTTATSHLIKFSRLFAFSNTDMEVEIQNKEKK